MSANRNEREIKQLFERCPQGARVIGITGGIASGKTAATDAIAKCGYTVIDADEISRAITHTAEFESKLTSAFPDCVSDGRINRRLLRKKIASDGKARHKLNNLTHPAITDETVRRLNAATPPVILSAPLMFECALAKHCDFVICVTCNRAERIKRICARDKVSPAEAESIIDAQISDAVRASLSDACVPSDTNRERFEKEMVELIESVAQQA